MKCNGLFVSHLLLYTDRVKFFTDTTERSVTQYDRIPLTNKNFIVKLHSSQHPHHTVIIKFDLQHLFLILGKKIKILQ